MGRKLNSFVRDGIFTLATAISIALVVAVLITRHNRIGYFGSFAFDGSNSVARRALGFGVDRGTMVFAYGRAANLPPGRLHYGFGVRGNGPADSYVDIPYWLALILLGILPARLTWNYVIAHRTRVEGKCVQCGYDLRATPERCPECGAVPSTSLE